MSNPRADEHSVSAAVPQPVGGSGSHLGIEPQPQPRTGARLASATFVVALIAAAIPVLTAVVSALSIISTDIGWSMVTALLVVPLAILGGGVAGLAAMILAVVLRVRAGAGAHRWVLSLVLGIFGMLAVPVTVIILVSTVG